VDHFYEIQRNVGRKSELFPTSRALGGAPLRVLDHWYVTEIFGVRKLGGVRRLIYSVNCLVMTSVVLGTNDVHISNQISNILRK